MQCNIDTLFIGNLASQTVFLFILAYWMCWQEEKTQGVSMASFW